MNRFFFRSLVLFAVLLVVALGCGDEDDDNTSDATGDDGDSDADIPRFVEVDYIELEKVARISKFRSGLGHDYSDDFESCRSMKHYFVPHNELDWSQVQLFSPVDGKIVQLDAGWAGTQIRIETTQHPGLFFILFHVNVPDLEVGDFVAAGQPLGFHIGPETWSDIAVGYATSEGWRLLSYFDVMSDALFESYRNRGVDSRDAVILSAKTRDNAPLSCDGETFTDEGTLENWIVLQ